MDASIYTGFEEPQPETTLQEQHLYLSQTCYGDVVIYIHVLIKTLDIFIGLLLMLAFTLGSKNRSPKLHYHFPGPAETLTTSPARRNARSD